MSATVEAWRTHTAAVGGSWSLCAVESGSGLSIAERAEVAHPAASIIKLPILVTVLDLVRSDRIGLSDRAVLRPAHRVGGAGALQHLDLTSVSVQQALTLMVTISDNVATNVLIDHVGMDRIRQTWTDPRYAGFQLGRLLGHEATGPEDDNLASAAAAVRLLTELDAGARAGDRVASLGLALLAQQQVRDRIPSHLPEDVACFNKTGELAGVRHDVALLRRGDRSVAVAMLASELPGVTGSSGGGPAALAIGRTAAALVDEALPAAD